MKQPTTSLSRRTLFAGAGGVAAATAAVTLLPHVPTPPPTPSESRPTPERGGGYHLSDHVLKYFKTARV